MFAQSLFTDLWPDWQTTLEQQQQQQQQLLFVKQEQKQPPPPLPKSSSLLTLRLLLLLKLLNSQFIFSLLLCVCVHTTTSSSKQHQLVGSLFTNFSVVVVDFVASKVSVASSPVSSLSVFLFLLLLLLVTDYCELPEDEESPEAFGQQEKTASFPAASSAAAAQRCVRINFSNHQEDSIQFLFLLSTAPDKE